MEVNDVTISTKKGATLMKTRKMKVFPARAKTLGVHRSKNGAKTVKERGLIWKAYNNDTTRVKSVKHFIDGLIWLNQMLKDFETKYGITRNQLKRFI